MRIYVASSWRNMHQPALVNLLRASGYWVYDFRHPDGPNSKGFSWAEIDSNWEKWTPRQYRRALQHPIAKRGYENDVRALRACDVCVLLLPSGRSASWELGWAMGAGKRGIVLAPTGTEPELMYREAKIVVTHKELLAVLKKEARQ